MNNQQMQGIKLAFLTALISGVSNFLNKKIIVSGIDPVILTIAKNGLVGLALLGFSFFLLKDLKNYSLKNWSKLILIAVVGGCIPFILYFKGLALTSATVGSFIHKTMFIWVAILAVIFLKEKMNKFQLVGLAVLFLGLLPIVKFSSFSIGRGELMMFVAVAFWSTEVILIKKFVQEIDYRIMAVFRMVLGTFFIAFFSLATGGISGIFKLTLFDWSKIVLVGSLLFGYTYTWYRSLSLAPANVATSILTLALPITIMLSSVNSIKLPNINDLTSVIFTAAGVLLFIKSFSQKPWKQPAPN
jgi:drug/metabolite transporter (DMT)-like permease